MLLDVVKPEHVLLTVSDWAKNVGLSARAYGAITDLSNTQCEYNRGYYRFFPSLLFIGDIDLLKVSNTGKKTIQEIKVALSSFDEGQYSFGQLANDSDLFVMHRDSDIVAKEGGDVFEFQKNQLSIIFDKDENLDQPSVVMSQIVSQITKNIASDKEFTKVRSSVSAQFILTVLSKNPQLTGDFSNAVREAVTQELQKTEKFDIEG